MWVRDLLIRVGGCARRVGLARVDRGRLARRVLCRGTAALRLAPLGRLPAFVERRDPLVGEAVVVDAAEFVAAQAVEGRDVAARDAHTRERIAGEAIGLKFLVDAGDVRTIVVVMLYMA